MASSKFDLSSGSPGRSLYGSGQRGTHITATMDRSGSFRESAENSVSPSLPNMLRNSSSSAVTHAEVTNYFKSSTFNPKEVAMNQKSGRHADLRQNIGAALGISSDESPYNTLKGKPVISVSLEELKRNRNGLRESLFKARERAKIFTEALSVFNKFFPSISTKKRSRSEASSNDRTSSDRSTAGPGLGKMGTHGNSFTNGLEIEQQKSEEWTKSSVPNKRTRTSMVDVKMEVRGNASARASGPVDREKELPKLPNTSVVQSKDHSLSMGVDGWEKSKMKKKRSGIKLDVSSGTVPSKAGDGYRETKQGMQQKSSSDARPRLSNDSHGFRSGVLNGAHAVGKSETVSQQSGLCARASVLKADIDSSSSLSDKKERPLNSDKERPNLKAFNKANVPDDFNSASPTSNARISSSVRGPRSNSGATPKSSPTVNKATASNDWEISHSTNKPPAAGGANNRKRAAPARSSSPPVAWTGQRTQKNSRSARRTNFVPIVASHDETSPMDTMSDHLGNEAGLGFPRRMSGSSPQHAKLKGDLLSSSVLSEVEDTALTETKSRERVKKADDSEDKSSQNVQKLSTSGMSSRKNKIISGDDLGDGIKKQGRSGRNFTTTRSLLPLSGEKLGNEENAKQVRSARLGFDKVESRTGRPPSRKPSDRKAYTRQRQSSINLAADFLVGSDDGHEELLAAANAVISTAPSQVDKLWRQMEPAFGFISDDDISYLKQQANLGSYMQTENGISTEIVSSGTFPNGLGFESEAGHNNAASVEVGSWDGSTIPLCQRLIAALIPEEVGENHLSDNEDLDSHVHGSRHDFDEDIEADNLSHSSLCNISCNHAPSINGYMLPGIPEWQEHEYDRTTIIRTRNNSEFDHQLNGLQDQALMPSLGCSEEQYQTMDIDEKVLLEIQSIAIYPEAVPHVDQIEGEGINDEIDRLMQTYNVQGSKKRCLLDKLLKSASEMKESQEREFEQHAMDRLVVMAFEKYMMCRGPNATGGKSSSGRMAKQAALAFIKRTLQRCKQFEDTGKSCFSEPIFMEIFKNGCSQLSVARYSDSVMEASRNTASLSRDVYPSDALLPANHLPEQITGREETWSNKVKKRELSLDEVVGGIVGSSGVSSVIGTPLCSSAKGKRSERDREGKGHGREVSRSGYTKSGRLSLSNAKGERKSKAKPKQKTTQLSVSINGLLGSASEKAKSAHPTGSKFSEMNAINNSKEKAEFGLDSLEDPIDLSGLQLPGMDELGVTDDLGGQGEDLASWLNNIDDDNLQDHDFMGLEIPMDDLSDLNMMV